MRVLTTIILFIVVSAVAPAHAQDWSRYENARFGYVVDIPPGFLADDVAENGDGRIFHSADGTQLLRVFGGAAPDGFEQTTTSAMDFAREDGWTLGYERTTPSWASFSGTRNGMIVYARAIALCGGDRFASFELHYPERDLNDMHSVVDRLVSSLAATGVGATC